MMTFLSSDRGPGAKAERTLIRQSKNIMLLQLFVRSFGLKISERWLREALFSQGDALDAASIARVIRSVGLPAAVATVRLAGVPQCQLPALAMGKNGMLALVMAATAAHQFRVLRAGAARIQVFSSAEFVRTYPEHWLMIEGAPNAMSWKAPELS